MAQHSGPIDQAIDEIDKLRKHLKKLRVRQVTALADCESLRAYSLAWTNSHRPQLLARVGGDPLKAADALYQKMNIGTYKATSRSAYLSILKDLREELIRLQAQVISAPAITSLQPPDFTKLVRDPDMKQLVARRMQEVIASLDKAPLAATIMMGALLEALFLARIISMPDRRPVFALKATPRDKHGKPRDLKEWGLNDFIEVSHEYGWVRRPLKDISTVLRDYRNIIHPVKELTTAKELGTAVLINSSDAKMFFRVFCELADQISDSVA